MQWYSRRLELTPIMQTRASVFAKALLKPLTLLTQGPCFSPKIPTGSFVKKQQQEKERQTSRNALGCEQHMFCSLWMQRSFARLFAALALGKPNAKNEDTNILYSPKQQLSSVQDNSTALKRKSIFLTVKPVVIIIQYSLWIRFCVGIFSW